MKKQMIKASNIENAITELEGIKKGLSGSIQKEIPYVNRKHIVVAMVKIIDKPGEVENDVKIDTVCYSSQRFEHVKKRFRFHGYTKIVILHDPSEMEEEIDVPVVPLHERRKTEAEIRAEVEAENEKEIKRRVEERLAKEKEVDEIKDIKTIDIALIEGMKSKELQEFAEEHKIDLSGLKNMEEYKVAITGWVSDLNKATQE